jgi:hypothetical protein
MRYWQEKCDDQTQLIVVTAEAVYAEEMDPADCQRRIGELTAGKSPATVFGKDATHVVLRSTSKVQRQSGDDDIDFTLRDGSDEKTESITIADEGIRNEVFAAIEGVTQGRFQRYEDPANRARAAFGPLTALAIFGFGSKIAASAAAVVRGTDGYEVSGDNEDTKELIVSVLNLLGPIGCWVIGGILLALSALVLYGRLSSPPSYQILQAEPFKPQGPIKTTLKYIALIAICALFAPLLLR